MSRRRAGREYMKWRVAMRGWGGLREIDEPAAPGANGAQAARPSRERPKPRRAAPVMVVIADARDPLSASERAALAEAARVAGRPQRADAIACAVLTPREAYPEIDDAEGQP